MKHDQANGKMVLLRTLGIKMMTRTICPDVKKLKRKGKYLRMKTGRKETKFFKRDIVRLEQHFKFQKSRQPEATYIIKIPQVLHSTLATEFMISHDERTNLSVSHSIFTIAATSYGILGQQK